MKLRFFPRARVEIYGLANNVAELRKQRSILTPHKLADSVDAYLTNIHDRDCIHIFSKSPRARFAVLGETEILGQVKDAYTPATKPGATGVSSIAFSESLLQRPSIFVPAPPSRRVPPPSAPVASTLPILGN